MKNVLIWKSIPAWRIARGCLAAVCLVLIGCRSTGDSGDPGMASVLISGNTPGQIRDAAVEVFGAHGFKTMDPDPAHLVFEKPGGHMANFTYGSWLGDDPVWMRVKATIRPAGQMSSRLGCSVFVVRDRGGSTEEQSELSRVHKRSYQKLLEEVAGRFVPR